MASISSSVNSAQTTVEKYVVACLEQSIEGIISLFDEDAFVDYDYPGLAEGPIKMRGKEQIHSGWAQQIVKLSPLSTKIIPINETMYYILFAYDSDEEKTRCAGVDMLTIDQNGLINNLFSRELRASI